MAQLRLRGNFQYRHAAPFRRLGAKLQVPQHPRHIRAGRMKPRQRLFHRRIARPQVRHRINHFHLHPRMIVSRPPPQQVHQIRQALRLQSHQ